MINPLTIECLGRARNAWLMQLNMLGQIWRVLCALRRSFSRLATTASLTRLTSGSAEPQSGIDNEHERLERRPILCD